MTQPIKILRVISRLNVGGPTLHVTLLTKKLTAPKYESRLITGQVGEDEGDMSYYAEEQGVTPLMLPELGKTIHPVRDIKTLWKLWRIIRDFKPDIVHTHTMKAGFVGRVAAKLAGVPVIVHTTHGHGFQGYFSPLKTSLFLNLERFAARLSDRVVTLTEGLRRDLVEVYKVTDARRVVVVALGLDLDRFLNMPRRRCEFRQQWNLAPDAPLVGIVGRLVPIKNHALFLDAAVLVKAANPKVKFIIVGDGEERASMEAQIDRLKLRDSVIFAGWRKDVEVIYSDLDLKVISSLNEGTPVTLIEAMAAGCPVVSTAVGGVPDLLQHGALGKIVASGDVEGLANAILETLDAPPDVEAIRAEIGERYGIARLVRDLDALYTQLLTEKRR